MALLLDVLEPVRRTHHVYIYAHERRNLISSSRSFSSSTGTRRAKGSSSKQKADMASSECDPDDDNYDASGCVNAALCVD